MTNELDSRVILNHARLIVARQEKDEGVFFRPEHLTESILQKAIKELHCVIKGDIFFKEFNK